MRNLIAGILLLFLHQISAQPKNPKELRRNCEKYIFNPQNVHFKIATPLQFFIEDLKIDQWQDTVSYYHGICRKPLPVVFEDDLTPALISAISNSYDKTKGHIPVSMMIKDFRHIPINGKPDLFKMIVYYYLKDHNSREKLIFISDIEEVVQGAYFEKKLSKLLKVTLLELNRKNPFFHKLPYYENVTNPQLESGRDGLLMDWNDVLTKSPIMKYPCEYTFISQGKGHPWYRIKNCEFEDFIPPRTAFGLIKNDSIFIRSFLRHFVYLEPIGNNYFLAKDHIFDKDQVIFNTILFGGAAGLLTHLVTERNVFYVFDPKGNTTIYTLSSLKKALSKEEDLLRKFKKLLSSNALTSEIRKMFITELLRRQSKIPRQ